MDDIVDTYFYICDGFACKRARESGGCWIDECKHTTDINHAKYEHHYDFEEVPGLDGSVGHFEKEREE